jgi:hypothetical protein
MENIIIAVTARHIEMTNPKQKKVIPALTKKSCETYNNKQTRAENMPRIQYNNIRKLMCFALACLIRRELNTTT